MRVAAALRDGITAGRFTRGAAVVLDAEPASCSRRRAIRGRRTRSGARSRPTPGDGDDGAAWLDRARYGLYPPGSTFKLLVAGAALREPANDGERFICKRLPDGRVGNYVRGMSRPVRDDAMDTVPHGHVDLERGLVVSCNAYFAQLAEASGRGRCSTPRRCSRSTSRERSTPEGVRPLLAQAGYGQGEAVVTPLKLARVSASIAAGGVDRPGPVGIGCRGRGRLRRRGSCRRATPIGWRARCAAS